MPSDAITQAVRAIVAGLSLGVAVNPVTAVVGCAGAAAVGALAARRGGRARWWLLIAVAAWVIGDAPGIALQTSALARGAFRVLGAAPPWSGWLFLSAWALCGLLVFYLLPAAAGVAVGRRVTWGTGWLAAAAVAGTLCLALLGAAPYVGSALFGSLA